MASNYPTSIDGESELPTEVAAPRSSTANAESINNLRGAIINIETELGTTPSGSELTVADRLTAISAATSGMAYQWNPFLLPDSPDAGDQQFTANTIPAGWTVWDQTGSSIQTETYGPFGVTLNSPGTTFELMGLYQAPTLPSRYRVSVEISLTSYEDSAGWAGAGVMVVDGSAPTSGRGVYVGPECRFGRSYLNFVYYTSYTGAFGAASGNVSIGVDVSRVFYGIVVDTVAGDLRPCMSYDGHQWRWADAARDYVTDLGFTDAPASVGFCHFNNNTAQVGGVDSIFRGYRLQTLDSTALTVDGLRPRGGFSDGTASNFNSSSQTVW